MPAQDPADFRGLSVVSVGFFSFAPGAKRRPYSSVYTEVPSGLSGTWGLACTALLKARAGFDDSFIHPRSPRPPVTGLLKAPGIPTVTPKFLSAHRVWHSSSLSVCQRTGAKLHSGLLGACSEASRLCTWPPSCSPSCAPAPGPVGAVDSGPPSLASTCLSPLFLTASGPPVPEIKASPRGPASRVSPRSDDTRSFPAMCLLALFPLRHLAAWLGLAAVSCNPGQRGKSGEVSGVP